MKKIVQMLILLSLSLASILKADEPVRKFSKFNLASEDTLRNDVIVFKGDARIDGVIEGTLSVYAGDVYLGKNGKVTGSIKSYAGKVYRDDQVDEASSYYLVNKLKSVVFRDPTERWEEYNLDFSNSKTKYHIGSHAGYGFFTKKEILPRTFASYTKAEGLYLGLGGDFNMINTGITNFGVYASGGYAFRDKSWKFYTQEQLGLYKENFVVGAVQYKNTMTEDSWKIDPDLNYLAALTIHEDFYNYYRSTGYGFYTGSALNFTDLTIPVRFGWKAGYYHDKIGGMDNATNYSLFCSGKDFAPAMTLSREGNMKTASASLFAAIGKRKSNELQLGGTYETTVNSVEQDFRFEKAVGSLSGRIDIGDLLFLTENFRLESSSFDSKDPARGVPDFKLTSLGGTGTLPGYALNSISGNKAVLSRTALGFRDSHLEDFRLYFDMGDAWSFANNDLLSGFDNISLDQLKKSAGIGILLGKETVFSIHKRLDTGHNSYQMQLTSTMNVDEIFNFKKSRVPKDRLGLMSRSIDNDSSHVDQDHKGKKKLKLKYSVRNNKHDEEEFDKEMQGFNEVKEEIGKALDEIDEQYNNNSSGDDEIEQDDEQQDADESDSTDEQTE